MNVDQRVKYVVAVSVLAWIVSGLLGGCSLFGEQRGAPTVSGDPAEASARAAEREARTNEQLEQADAARDAGEYRRALSIFREILAENPTVTTAYLGIGSIYIEQGDYASAEPAYARAARLEPRNFDAQFGHGLALQMLGRFDEAVRAYHKALVVSPDSPKANLNLATTYIQLNEMGSARVFAEKAVEVDPGNGPARVNLGAIYDELGMHNEAVEEYRTAMELVEPTPELILNLVKALSNAKRYRETIEAAEQLNRMSPNANAYERIGHAWFRLKDYDKSIEAYRQAVDIDPDHWPAWNGIGVNALNKWLLSKKRDADARRIARDAMRQSLRINPKQPKVIQLMSTYRL